MNRLASAQTADGGVPVSGSPAATTKGSSDHGSAVRSVVRRLLRRGVLLGLVGLVLAAGFVVAFRSNGNRVAKERRSGVTVDAEVQEYVVGPPRSAWVRYDFEGLNRYVQVELDLLAPSYVQGQQVKVVVRDPDKVDGTSIVGTEKASRLTSLPAAVLFVLALAVLGLALFEIQAAVRALRHLKSGTWRTWSWRGAVDGPGRGRVNAAGYVTSPDRKEAHLLVNAHGCWREGLDLLEGKAVVHVFGNPGGHVLVRHPAALRPVILRPPKNQRKHREAMARIESRVDPIVV
jgi:hypothetical protein